MLSTSTVCLILLGLLLLALSAFKLRQDYQADKEHYDFYKMNALENVSNMALDGQYYPDTIGNMAIQSGISRPKINNIM
jgi:hypothetical protein